MHVKCKNASRSGEILMNSNFRAIPFSCHPRQDLIAQPHHNTCGMRCSTIIQLPEIYQLFSSLLKPSLVWIVHVQLTKTTYFKILRIKVSKNKVKFIQFRSIKSTSNKNMIPKSESLFGNSTF